MSALEPRQCWRTPPDLWGQLNCIWPFTVDAAADKESALLPCYYGHDNSYDPYKDGLLASWREEYVYCNPGFGDMAPWLAKAITETRGECYLAVVMALVDPSTVWWSDLAMQADEIVFLTPRVKFIPHQGVKMSSNSKPNCLLVYRRRPPYEHAMPAFRVWKWK